MTVRVRLTARRRERDRGMTLIEVVISTAILAMMMTLVVGAISVVFRSHSGVTNTTASSHDIQQAVSFFYHDVQSGPAELAAYRVAGDGGGPTGSGCDDAGDDNVLRFDAGDRRIAYRLESHGATAELDRVECVADASGWTERSTVNIADALDDSDGDAVVAQIVASSEDPDRVDRVVLSFASVLGSDEQVSATPRAEIAAESPPTTSSLCTDGPLDATEEFQVFIHGDMHVDGTQVKQSLAVGGALSFDGNVAVAQNMNQAGDFPTASGLENAGLLVGSIDWAGTGSNASMTVHSGADAAFGDFSGSDQGTQGQKAVVFELGDANERPDIGLQAGGTVLTGSTSLDFDAAFEMLGACSERLGGLPNSCATCAEHVELTNNSGGAYEGIAHNPQVQLVLTDDTVNTFNLDEGNLAALTHLKWDSVAPSATAPLIINVATGSDATFESPQVQGAGSTASHIVWNFPNVTGTLTITGGGGSGIWGTVMAPYAHVESSVKIEGGVVARSFEFGGSSVNPSRSFDGDVSWD